VRTVLVTGETGAGKEPVAKALPQLGPRRSKRFVTVNCSAVVEGLFESELFGHVRGAFTGAAADKPGLFEVADRGTLFLDEIGELPLALQAKLLRVIESGDVQRVGSVQPWRVDVHLLAATNRDLAADVAAGRFRSDLFYRLNVVELWVPPLRERRDDIPYLTAAFVRESAARMNKQVSGLTPAAERSLATANWNGNVRELRHLVERACIMADGDFITERDLTPRSGLAVARGTESDSLSEMERQRIVEVLERMDGNKMAAAKALGLTRWALYRRMELYGIGDKSPDPSQ
jgi:transcriptional regulator with GAF, ATPase, and Fis domain